MAQSGVTVDDGCVHAFDQLKSKRAFKYITFKVNTDLGSIVVDRQVKQTAASDAVTTKEDYAEFFDHLSQVERDGECCYAVYDFYYETSEGGRRQKLAFVLFCPDTSSIKKKMLYASSKDALKEKLVGVLEIQASDSSDIELSEIRDKCLKSTTYK